ncbi:unnamed protein product [Acanthoscelides obtectus]|uniref:protein disulfide-isomerase n=1 Tax=Acanthoscelides obtectus TaxID=200917 RepID=A0A9P0JZ73_ACAOB|nr:unnamed protein product [Acanthoscelides obtectus]CAK1663946.1 Protein disulfide-isomerase A3 [Acanthoscelides obtectus]
MKSMLKLILLFLLAYQRSSTHELVEELTDINFNETITNQPVSAVLFYASKDCEMCSQMVKRFTTAASRLVEFEQPIGFYKIDCLDEGKDTCDEQMVIDPPTIEIYRHGEYANEVKRIQLQQMIEIIKKVARMGSIRVDTLQELDDLLNMNLYVVLGLFEDDSDLRKVYLRVSDKMMDRYLFLDTSSKELLDHFQLKDDIIILRIPELKNDFEDRKDVYKGSPDTKQLKQFVEKKYHGLVAIHHKNNKHLFKPPMVLIYCHHSDDGALIFWRNQIYPVATKFSQNVTFVVSNLTQELKGYGYDILTDHVAVVAKDTVGQKFVMDDEFNYETFEEFVTNFLEKKLVPFLKSQPIPENSGRLVKEIVGKSFRDLVLNSGRDTFIGLYAAWSPHCQSLEEQYDQLAKKLADEDIDIVRMNVNENDVPLPYHVIEYPTAYFAPKSNKSHPILYDGEKKLDTVIRFIARHATEELKGWDRLGNKKKLKTSSKTEL